MNLLQKLLDIYMIGDRLPPGKVDAVMGVGCSLTPKGKCAAQTRAVAEEAAILFLSEDFASCIVLAGDGYHSSNVAKEAEEMAEHIRHHQFGPYDVIVVPHGSNTRENAEDIARLCKEMGWTTILVVAEPLHARRVVAAVRRVAPDLEVFTKKAPLSPYGDSDKWQLKSHWRFLLWEVFMLAYFRLRGWA